jgi:hypothetical protein
MISYSHNKIMAELTNQQYNKVLPELKEMQSKVTSQTMDIRSPIIVNFTKLPDGMTLKDKAEGKFDVIITNTVRIEEGSDGASSRGGSGYRGRGGRGSRGGRGGY